jgi:hypothetical protein
MKPTMNGRVSTLETVYTEVIKPMRADLKAIKVNTQTMSIQNEELLRKVGEHHTFINTLKIAKCPTVRLIPDNNRKKNERKWDQKKYKTWLWITIIGSLTAILALFGWLGSVLIAAGQILESLPK